MKKFLSRLILPAVFSLTLVVPFAVLEAVNTAGFTHTYGFPATLFTFMWALGFVFLTVLMSIVRALKAGENVMAHPAGLLLKTTLLVAIAVVWTGLVNDQMPCFLGVPNCD